MHGPPLLTVSWGLDHLRVPQGIGLVFRDGRGVGEVTSGVTRQSFHSRPCCTLIPRPDGREEGPRASMILQHHHTRACVSGSAGPEEGQGPDSVSFASPSPT